MSTYQTPPVLRTLERCIEQSLLHHEAAKLSLLRTRDDAARNEAAAYDALLAHNPAGMPLAGAILTVKSCFDVAGWVSHAGSRVLAKAQPASQDAPLVARLRQAGAVLRAQTNMAEFAYGALGLNPWYGTPTTPLMPDKLCVAGGSSSGAAVATALGMANLALGSDTSGSVRIPAAFCGVAGFKPSRGRYSDEGLLHLSPSFDVPGLIATTAAMCRQADHAIAGCNKYAPIEAGVSLEGLRLIVPEAWLSSQLDATVGQAFELWLNRLASAGAQIQVRRLPMLAEAGRVASEGGIIAAEAYQLHAHRLDENLPAYDSRVGPRMLLGAEVKAHLYVSALKRLRALAAEYNSALKWADAVLTPTVPMLPPSLASLQDDDIYTSQNRRAFHITEFANRLDAPSISLPGNLRQRQPVGLLRTGKRGCDTTLLIMAECIERVLTAHS